MSGAGPSLRERAIRLLALREHSRSELARKLAAHGSADEIDATLARLGELGLQSDERFARAWIRSKAARFGLARLRHELARRGLAREVIEDALALEADASEIDRARAVWAGKFGKTPQDRSEWAKQARFLQGRGFSADTITRLLKENPDESA